MGASRAYGKPRLVDSTTETAMVTVPPSGIASTVFTTRLSRAASSAARPPRPPSTRAAAPAGCWWVARRARAPASPRSAGQAAQVVDVGLQRLLPCEGDALHENAERLRGAVGSLRVMLMVLHAWVRHAPDEGRKRPPTAVPWCCRTVPGAGSPTVRTRRLLARTRFAIRNKQLHVPIIIVAVWDVPSPRQSRQGALPT